MNRRDVLRGALAITAAASAAPVLAAAEKPAGKQPDLGEVAAECMRKGIVCVQHCIDMIGMGDKSMTRCAKAATEMVTFMDGLQKLAATDSPYLADYGRVALKVLADCEAACKEHAPKHASCKHCMESCQKTAAVLKETVIAATRKAQGADVLR